MKVGYARVSTEDQKLDLQLDALKAQGCDRIFTDQISGSFTSRAGLDEALRFVRDGDVLIVWRLDRLGRSLKHLMDTLEDLDNRKISFVSVSDNIDTTTSLGRLMFHLFGAFAQFERELIKERVNAGIKAAKDRGVKLGAKEKFTDNYILMVENEIKKTKRRSARAILEDHKISTSTYHRRLNEIKKTKQV